MPPSKPDDLETLSRRLAEADPSDRPELAPQAISILFNDLQAWDDVTPDVASQLLSFLDEDDPTTKSVGVFFRHKIRADEYNLSDSRSDVIASVFNALSDESPVVRQTAAHSRRLGSIVGDVLEDDKHQPISRDRFTARLFELLQDPDPAVRRRIGKVFFKHGEGLLAAHPEPATAVRSLVDATADPLNAYCTYTRPVVSPRQAALMTLEKGFEEYDSALIVDHAVGMAEHLTDDRRRVRSWAARLLDTFVSTNVIAPTDIADDVITAAKRYNSRGLGWEFPQLAVKVALTNQSAVEPVYNHLRTRYTAANTRTSTWGSSDLELIALSRLVRAADRSFDPPAETLATIIAHNTAATDETDPLVLLAPDHPEFVADQLRQGYQLLVDGELDYNSRFYRDLVVDVADQNPAAIKNVPELLAENFSRSGVRKTMTALVDAHPTLAAHLIPDAYARTNWEPPLRYQHSQLIEDTTEHWEGITDNLTKTLIETVGTDRSEKRRRGAIRALVALDEAGLSVLPERFTPFIELYHRGAFDDDGDPVDPLETDAADVAGLR